MSEVVIVAVISFLGTLAGSGLTALAQSRVTNHRIQELEKKVDKHNNLVERMYQAEADVELLEEKVKVANHRIEDLEKER